MIIKNLTIENFQSYYGETSLDFERGLNLIIGNGGKGKSKLFNAFYWALFGEIYITDIGWCATNTLPHSAKFSMGKHEIINMKALYDCPVGDSVNCSVHMEIEKDNGDMFIIDRVVKAERNVCENWNDENAWTVSENMLKVTYDTNEGTVTKRDVLAEVLISELFKPGIRGYIWFQGETLDNLINFRKPQNLKDAVKHISYYPYYEKMTAIISNAKSRIETQESKRLRERNKQNGEAKALLFRIDQLRSNLQIEETNRQKAIDNIGKIQVALAEDEGKVSGLAKFSELVSKYDACEIEIKDINFRLTEIDKKQRELLPSLWVLRGSEHLISKAKEIINNRVEEVYTVPEKKYIDNPSRSKLEEILYKDHRCFVCGSPVDEAHPHAIEWIQNRLRLQDEFLREMEEYTNNIEFSAKFNMFMGKIQDYPDALLTALKSIDPQYQKMEDKIDNLILKRKSKLEQKRKYEEQIEDIKRKHGVDPRKEASQFTTFDRTIKATRANLEREQRKLASCENNIKELKIELKQKERQMTDGNSNGGMVTQVDETEWKVLSTILEALCKRVQEKAKRELLHKIEERANAFYTKFTEHDIGYKGRVEIGEDYSIQYDAKLNTSHEDRKKMSIINALLSLNQESLNVFYPFISDAPTSSFDPNTTHKYLIGIKDIFEQSIIMTKDVVIGSEKYQDIYSQNKVTKIYELSSRIYGNNAKDPEIFEVSTNVERLK